MKRMFFLICNLLGLNALFRWVHRGDIKILLYHSISGPGSAFSNAVPSHDFKAQLHHLKAYYNVVGLSPDGVFTGYRSDMINVLISFDDGFVDNLHTAARLLHEEGLPAIFFLIAGCIRTGCPPDFILSRLSQGQIAPSETYTMTINDARELLSFGMTIGSHGQKHIDYISANDTEAISDAKESRTELESALGVPVAAFAFPWGKHREGQTDSLLSYYRRIFLTAHGFNRPDDQVLYRNEVANLPQMRCASSGLLDFFSSFAHPLRSLQIFASR